MRHLAERLACHPDDHSAPAHPHCALRGVGVADRSAPDSGAVCSQAAVVMSRPVLPASRSGALLAKRVMLRIRLLLRPDRRIDLCSVCADGAGVRRRTVRPLGLFAGLSKRAGIHRRDWTGICKTVLKEVQG